MVNASSFVGGCLLTLLAGALNGAWNICVKDNAPGFLKAIDRSSARLTSENNEFTFDHAWGLGMLHATLLNLVLCFTFLTPEFLTSTIQQAATVDVIMIILFSVLWGLGTFGFGMAVQVAGLGMGTTLTMSVIVVIGTLLPLILDVEGKLLTVSGSLVVLGLLVCAGSFVFASIALSRKDADEALQKKEKGLEMKALEEMKVEVAEEEQYSTFQKVAVCVISGVACTTLQFAFVFSEDLRDIAESEYGISSLLSPLITFTFAISICAFTNTLISFIKLVQAGRLGALWKNERSAGYCLKTFLFIACPWVFQSYLYGLSANALLGAELGAAVGWPVLIVTTNTTGLIIGWKVLKEWDAAGVGAVNMIKMAILSSVLGLGVIAVGGIIA